jgi:chromatin segregation and condensation protein Rec8/ScpA/Scc1 (kleisin family)
LCSDLCAIRSRTLKPNEEKILGRTGHTSGELLDVRKEMLKLDLAMKDADKMFAESPSDEKIWMSKIIAQLNQTASVPEYTDNKLISNNSRMQAQIAETSTNRQGINTVEERNSSEILNVLRRIEENTKSSGSSGPSKMNGGGEPYVNLVYTTRTRVDPKLGNMMGGNYTSNDSIKATK